ncbi:FHA domain-containing protein [Enorma phocaeensis]|uniref:FHA domain-containing protein n=1 Tax=Enorma phocaeensis TaxID=1871019 RepID=UPI000C845DC0|nr:FHA domain-containing protein [Enorma phocaeensis]
MGALGAAGDTLDRQDDGRSPRKRKTVEGWDSAFYRFAEGIRIITGGAVNHKAIYALVGTNARYANHANPLVRKRTAAALSRLIHSTRYAAEMRERFQDDPELFVSAGSDLACRVSEASSQSVCELLDVIDVDLFPSLLEGFASEARAGRPELNVSRIERELRGLGSWARHQCTCGNSPLPVLFEALLHMLAFGCIPNQLAHLLVCDTPVAVAAPSNQELPAPSTQGCLVKIDPAAPCELLGLWPIEHGVATLGRFTDTTIIESDPYVSRLHCRVYAYADGWFVEDAHARYGTRVLRRGADHAYEPVYDSLGEGAGSTFELRPGDVIELARRVSYLFCLYAPARPSQERMEL